MSKWRQNEEEKLTKMGKGPGQSLNFRNKTKDGNETKRREPK